MRSVFYLALMQTPTAAGTVATNYLIKAGIYNKSANDPDEALSNTYPMKTFMFANV